MGSVGNHKDLHIFVQACTCPKAVPLIPVNLVEGFFQRHTPAFQFHMHQRQTVHQYGNIITVIIIAAFLRILIQDLQIIVMNVILINQRNVLGGSVITLQHLYIVFLNLLAFVFNSFVSVRNILREETLPLVFRKSVIV